MKTLNILLIAILLMTFSQISAQDKTKSDKDQEQELQQAIKEQKRALNEQRKAQEQAQKEIEKAQQDQEESQKDLQENLNNLDVLKEYNFDVQSDDNGNVRVYSRRGGNHIMVPQPPDAPFAPGDFYFNRFGDDSERTTWDFSKSVKETSFKRDYTFDVEKTVKTVVMSVNGDCKAGEINIKIITPNGKTFSDIVIDEFGNLNWRKSFNISDTENQDKTGDWTFKISSNKATGHFRISLQTF
jgi:hypothetical protein